jgi:hypothetical protein
LVALDIAPSGHGAAPRHARRRAQLAQVHLQMDRDGREVTLFAFVVAFQRHPIDAATDRQPKTPDS